MKRLLLLGGGHSHLRVLAEIARAPLAGWEVRLLTPSPRQLYSGMLPGWVAGHYSLDQCSIDLQRLAARAGVEFRQDRAVAIDPTRRQVSTQLGAALPYDVLSIDIGPSSDAELLPGADAHAVAIRPVEGFVAWWQDFVEQSASRCSRFDLAVLGAGAGGLELAFAVRHRSMVEGWSQLQVHLVGAEALPLPGSPGRARTMALQLLRRKCIQWHGGRRAQAVRAGEVVLDNGETIAAHATWLVTGARAPSWLAEGGLATDDGGFIRVNRCLQSLSHPDVFAAGDVSAHADGPPKSGVYAVRAGPVLARNLLAYCTRRELVAWRPQQRALYLISTGERAAIAMWGSWAWMGKWVWTCKDAIDRRFVGSWV